MPKFWFFKAWHIWLAIDNHIVNKTNQSWIDFFNYNKPAKSIFNVKAADPAQKCLSTVKQKHL